jgi:hypothetical protein
MDPLIFYLNELQFKSCILNLCIYKNYTLKSVKLNKMSTKLVKIQYNAAVHV